MTRFFLMLVGAFALLLSAGSAAMAATTAKAGYIDPASAAQGDLSGVNGAVAAGSLPFTGLDLTLIVLGGVALLATGIILRRTSRQGR